MGTTIDYVYAVGRVEARFPSPAAEKEFTRVTGQEDITDPADPQLLKSVLSQRENRYLAPQLCWILAIEGLETYILVPRDPADLHRLVEAAGRTGSAQDLDVVIGVRGPIAPPGICSGLTLPVVRFDHIFPFDRDTLTRSIPKPGKMSAEDYAPVAENLYMTIMQMADNVGATDEHRALNYCAVRYPAIYTLVGEASGRNAALTALEVRPSRLDSTRKIMEVILTFTDRQTGMADHYFVSVDVTEMFPFLVTKLAPYTGR